MLACTSGFPMSVGQNCLEVIKVQSADPTSELLPQAELKTVHVCKSPGAAALRGHPCPLLCSPVEGARGRSRLHTPGQHIWSQRPVTSHLCICSWVSGALTPTSGVSLIQMLFAEGCGGPWPTPKRDLCVCVWPLVPFSTCGGWPQSDESQGGLLCLNSLRCTLRTCELLCKDMMLG